VFVRVQALEHPYAHPHGESFSPHFEVGEIPGSSSADEVEIVLVKCM